MTTTLDLLGVYKNIYKIPKWLKNYHIQPIFSYYLMKSSGSKLSVFPYYQKMVNFIIFSIPEKVPEGHIALIVLDSQIIPAHLLRVVLSFIYTNELSDLDESDTQTNCQLASDSELSKDSVISLISYLRQVFKFLKIENFLFFQTSIF